MGKVSIGLHGWRFDESELFGDDDEWRSLEAMSPDTRKRLLRLQTVIGKPCDACYLIHGEAELLDDIRPEFEGEGVKKVGSRDDGDADTTGETADDTGEESGDAGDDPDVDNLDVDDLDLDREYPGS